MKELLYYLSELQDSFETNKRHIKITLDFLENPGSAEEALLIAIKLKNCQETTEILLKVVMRNIKKFESNLFVKLYLKIFRVDNLLLQTNTNILALMGARKKIDDAFNLNYANKRF